MAVRNAIGGCGEMQHCVFGRAAGTVVDGKGSSKFIPCKNC